VVEVVNKENPTELKPPYLLENWDVPSVDWNVVADLKKTFG
jgi:hypothetical protein